MDSGTRMPVVRRLPRARVTLPMVALLGIGLVARPALSGGSPLDEASALGMADVRGMVPISGEPTVGTEIFQWDAELRDIAPFFVGAVTRRDWTGDHHAVIVKRPHAPPLMLAIRPHELRYWVRKP